MLETDHQSYVNCICGTTVSEQPFDNIWNVLMILLHHFEDMFRIYAPSKILLIERIKKRIYSYICKDNQFHRSIQCPYCNEYSFMVSIVYKAPLRVKQNVSHWKNMYSFRANG
jgi:hypothetical protein